MSTPELQFLTLSYIVVTGGPSGFEGQRLTDEEGNVTIAPPTAAPDIKQEWQINREDNGDVTIRRPGDFVPTPYLTYDGVPKDPEQGNRIIVQLPNHNEWRVVRAGHGPVFKGFLQVAKSNSGLGIAIAPLPIYPPILDLNRDHQLVWSFIPVPPSDE